MPPGVSESIVSLYDGAAGLTSWNTVLATLKDLFSANTVVLFSQVPGRKDASFLGGTGASEKARQDYLEYFSTRNILMQKGEALHAPGIVRTSETICSRSVFLESEYYRDFLRPNNVRYSMGITAVRESDRAVHLTAFRPPDMGPFVESDTAVFADLYPHIRQAMRIHSRLAVQEQQTLGLEAALARLGRGIALLNPDGGVVYLNAALEQMLAEADGLTLTRDGLSAAARTGARGLRAAVDDAARGGSGATVPVTRPSGKLPYSVLVAPILKRVPFLGRAQAAVMVIVSDPSSTPPVNGIVLQQMYGFTAAEARVVRRLVSGASLKEIAAQMNLSAHTVRTQLKSALRKSGTHRQSDLVRLILTGRV